MAVKGTFLQLLAEVFKNILIWNLCCVPNFSWNKKTQNQLQSAHKEVTKMD